MQTIGARFARNGERRKISTFQKNMLSILRHTAVLSAHYSGNSQRTTGVRNDERILTQLSFLPVEQYQLFTRTCGAHLNAIAQLLQIKGMHGLPQLQKYIICHIHYRINTSQATSTQFFGHPKWCGRTQIHIANDSPEIARARRRIIKPHRESVVDGCRHLIDFRPLNNGLIEHAHLTGQARNRQTVTPVWCQVYFDCLIFKLQVTTHTLTHWCIRQQGHQAIRIF